MKYYDSAERTWQVMSVLRQALPDSEIQRIFKTLPDGFREIFGEQVPGSAKPRP